MNTVLISHNNLLEKQKLCKYNKKQKSFEMQDWVKFFVYYMKSASRGQKFKEQ